MRIGLLLMLVVAMGTGSDVHAKTIQGKQAHSGVQRRAGYWSKMVLTKYCQTGLTASGTYTHWGTVSSTFRFGTHFNIPGYSSWATAEDTGSAVGYGHLDLYDPSCNRSMIFGRRYASVFIYYK